MIALLLSAYTSIIFILAFFIWKRTKSFAFMLGIFFLFYWGMAGSWIFYFDALSGFKGEAIGLHYYYLFDVLFDVKLNKSFLIAISLHSLFIISIQLSVLFFYRNQKTNVSKVLLLDYRKLYLIALIAIAISSAFIWSEITEAFQDNKILYHVVELNENRFFSLHQLFLQISITAVVFLTGLLLSPTAEKIKLNSYSVQAHLLIFPLLVLILSFLAVLGNKKELMFAGMLTILFFLSNNRRGKKDLKRLLILSMLIILPLFSTDIIRGKNFRSLLSLDFEGKKVETEKEKRSLKDVFGSVVFSNELFFANLSMYGAIEKDVPVAPGISFKYLAASMIPRAIKKDRPEDVYVHYANGVGANLESGQGYTIHHATAWLLNFGVFGVLLGGVIIGFIWGRLSSLQIIRNAAKYKQILIYLVPAITCAYLPVILRSGIESYKGFIIEGIIFTCLLVYISLEGMLSKRQLSRRSGSKNHKLLQGGD